MSNKMINCKTCGQEIASTAKICPNCGAKVKKPIFKKWWFWLIVAIIAISLIAGMSGNGTDKNTASDSSDTSAVTTSDEGGNVTTTYTQYDVTQLFDAVKGNALKAQNDLKGQYIEIHGYLSNIDSNGSYISVGASKDNYDYMFESVHCNIKYSNKDAILNKVMSMNVDQPIVVKGKVTDVGEVLGIFLDIDSIE